MSAGGTAINFEILSVKSDSVENPREFIPGDKFEAISSIDGLAIGEIAGRDSIAAIIEACKTYNVKAVLPTVVYTGTEYGDWSAPEKNIAFLKAAVGDACDVLDTVFVGSPDLWAALNGRYLSVILQEYGIYSPCMACHLYMHLCRVPLSVELGGIPIISGERDSHQGCIKLSQTPSAIDASVQVIAYAGIELLLPIRRMESNSDIEELVGPKWEQGQHQLRCVLSGNYNGLDKEVLYDSVAHKRYIEEFLIPSGKAIIDSWRTGSDVDYNTIVKGILRNIVGVKV